MDHDADEPPTGIRALGTDGALHDLGEPQRLPDEDGVRVWLVTIPPGLPLRQPVDIRMATLPPRTEVRFEGWVEQ